ncbi:MAG: Ig-like domain-containing protein, partial [Bacteroidaceae bacterium]|nr:Ig-like domain-containing protein [Bacteroidaceae bacterium]
VSADGSAEGEQFQFYRNQKSATEKYTEDPNITVGAAVIGFGNLTKYDSTYEFAAKNYLVSITKKTVESIAINTMPDKVTYNEGEELDLTGGAITVNYSDATSTTLSMTASGVAVTGYDKTAVGTQTLTVTYCEKTTTFNVTVNALQLYTVTFNPGTGTCGIGSATETSGGSGVELPTATAPTGWEFAEWSTASVAETTTEPTTLVGGAGETYHPTENITLYAVYRKASGESDVTSTFNVEEYAAANGWSNGTTYSGFTIDGVTYSQQGDGNNGKYYSSDNTWRFYAGGTACIDATGTIKSVTSSPELEFDIDGKKATYSGAAKFKSIEVVYISASYTYNTNPSSAAVIPVTGVTIDKTEATVSVGSTTTLIATITPSDATNKNVTWTSADEDIATVTDGGVVTGVAMGNTTITVTTEDGGFTATCAITVEVAKGTKENPYTIAEVIALDNPGKKAWVKGYIAGTVSNNALDTDETKFVSTNFALVDDIESTEAWVPVQLPTGAVRTAINLLDYPELQGIEVLVYGSLEAYFSKPGIKSTSDYEILSAQLVTVGTEDISSFCSDKALNFTNAKRIQAYTATSVTGTSVNLTQVTGTVAANTGLIIKGTEGTTEYIPVVSSGDTPAGNMLKPIFTGESIAASTEGCYHYVFGTKNGVKAFYKLVNTPMTSTGNFAYLESDTDYLAESAIAGLTLNFDEETAIEDIVTKDNEQTEIYTLSGIRLSQPVKGINIIGGKKVLVK